MRRRRFTQALVSATLQMLIPKTEALAVTADRRVLKKFAVGSDIDGIVIRGGWRAHVTLGDPSLTIAGTAATVRAVAVVRSGTTLTIESSALYGEPFPALHVSVARLRGLATSGSVLLTIEDRGERSLFLDLAGSGSVRAKGFVPLLRVTTSGTVVADLTALKATSARVHARQKSVLKVRALDTLTIVAVDTARVSYAGTRVQLTVRNAANANRL